MKKTKEIIGLPIISIFDGTEIGMVKNIIINAEDRSFSYVVVENGLHLLGAKVIATDRILGIGEHAVTVENDSVVSMISKIPAAMDLLEKNVQVRGSKVLTKKGRLVGEITEIYVDEDDCCRIKGMEFLPLRGDGNAKFLPDNNIITYGRHLIIVSESIESSLVELSEISNLASAPAEGLTEKKTFDGPTGSGLVIDEKYAADAAAGPSGPYAESEFKTPAFDAGVFARPAVDYPETPFVLDGITPVEIAVEAAEEVEPVEIAVEAAEEVEPVEIAVEAAEEVGPVGIAVEPADAVEPVEIAVEAAEEVEPVEIAVEAAEEVEPVEIAVEAADAVAEAVQAAELAIAAEAAAEAAPASETAAPDGANAYAEDIGSGYLAAPPAADDEAALSGRGAPINFDGEAIIAEEPPEPPQPANLAGSATPGAYEVSGGPEAAEQAEGAAPAAFEAESAAIAASDNGEAAPDASRDNVIESETSLFEQRQKNFLMGRIVTKTILDNKGNILVEEGARITEEIIESIRSNGRMVQLVMNNR